MATMTWIQRRAGLWVLLLLTVLQAAMTVVQFSGGDSPGGRGVDLLISPAPYAFAIWGVIYLLCVVHAAVAVRKGTAVADQAALVAPLAALYLASASWSVAFTVGNSWLTFAVLAVMVAAALRALRVAMNHPLRSGARRWEARLESFTVGLYCGWVTVAVFVNLASALGDQELADPASAGWQAVVLTCALAAVLAALWLGRGSDGVAVAAVWALAAVVVNVGGQSVLLAVTSGIGIAAVLAVWLRTALAGDNTRRVDIARGTS